jgi:PAS domain S-box-containing protein
MKNQTKSAMISQFRNIRTLVLFLVLAGFAFQLSPSTVHAEKGPDEILAGVHRNFPPQYSIDETTGNPTGFAIDIMNEIARRAGLKIRYVVFDEWPQILLALKAGRIDIIPNLGIIEERTANCDFTDPVEAFDIKIFVRETTTDIHGINDLQGRKVAVVRDNKGLFIIQEYGRAKPSIFNSPDEALLSLLSGNTDAWVYPEPVVFLIARKSKLAEHIKAVGKPLLEVKRAFAVRKGNTDLLNKLDTAVKELIPTQEYKKIYAKWYGAPASYWDVRRVSFAAGIFLVLVIAIFSVWHYLSLMRLNRVLKYSLEEGKLSRVALRQSEEKFRTIFDMASDGILIADAKTKKFLQGNNSICTMLGYTKEEIESLTIDDIHPPHDISHVLDEFEKLVKDEALAGDLPVLRKDGSIFYAAIGGSPVIIGGKNYALGIFRDITDRKRSEEALRGSIELFSAFMRHSPIYTFMKEVTPTKSIVLQASENYRDMIGIPGSEMVGKTMGELFPSDFATKITADDWDVVSKGNVLKLDEELNGRSYTTIKFPIVQGDKTFLAGYTIDITERKKAEEQVQASLLEKETMLKEIHHRVKNNLQVIASLLSLQASYLHDEKAIKALEESIERVETMASIHTQLYESQDLTRVDFGSFIKDLISNIGQSYGRAESPIEINVDAGEISLGIDNSIPCGLILNELVSNALKHAFPEGREGAINIRMRSEDNQVVLTVQDNGIGFPELIDLMNVKSLGLDLVSLLVAQMNGKMDMRVEGGTTWTITFPVKKDREWQND